jgi:hypothetical protein
MLTIGMHPEHAAMPWMLSGFAFAAIESASKMTILLGFLGQLLVFTGLTARLTRQLRRAGESELKALMAEKSHRNLA